MIAVLKQDELRIKRANVPDMAIKHGWQNPHETAGMSNSSRPIHRMGVSRERVQQRTGHPT